MCVCVYIYIYIYIQGPPKKCIHTLTKENSALYNRLLQIYNIFPSTQQYDICIYMYMNPFMHYKTRA